MRVFGPINKVIGQNEVKIQRHKGLTKFLTKIYELKLRLIKERELASWALMENWDFYLNYFLFNQIPLEIVD